MPRAPTSRARTSQGALRALRAGGRDPPRRRPPTVLCAATRAPAGPPWRWGPRRRGERPPCRCPPESLCVPHPLWGVRRPRPGRYRPRTPPPLGGPRGGGAMRRAGEGRATGGRGAPDVGRLLGGPARWRRVRPRGGRTDRARCPAVATGVAQRGHGRHIPPAGPDASPPSRPNRARGARAAYGMA